MCGIEGPVPVRGGCHVGDPVCGRAQVVLLLAAQRPPACGGDGGVDRRDRRLGCAEVPVDRPGGDLGGDVGQPGGDRIHGCVGQQEEQLAVVLPGQCVRYGRRCLLHGGLGTDGEDEHLLV